MVAFFPFIDIPIIPESMSSFQKIIFSIIVLALLTLWSFIDIVGHFITLYFIDHTKVGEKYPKIKPLLNYFKKTNYIFLTFEIIFFISIYIMVIEIYINLLLIKN